LFYVYIFYYKPLIELVVVMYPLGERAKHKLPHHQILALTHTVVLVQQLPDPGHRLHTKTRPQLAEQIELDAVADARLRQVVGVRELVDELVEGVLEPVEL
jgi:hypothetical protein